MTIIREGDRVRMTQILEGRVTDYTPNVEISIETDNAGAWVFELPLEEGVHTIEVIKRQPQAGEMWSRGSLRRFYYFNSLDRLCYMTAHGESGYARDSDADYWEFEK